MTTEANRRLTQKLRLQDDLAKTEISNGSPEIKARDSGAFNSMLSRNSRNELLKDEATGSRSSASVLTKSAHFTTESNLRPATQKYDEDC